jgi:hypothetical protein
MNSDTKVGLALGILIMGVAVAFFFRVPVTNNRQDRIQQLAPGITEIDKELTHRSNRPYLPSPAANDVEGDHEDPKVATSFPPLNQIIYQGAATAPAPLKIDKTVNIDQALNTEKAIETNQRETNISAQSPNSGVNKLASIDTFPQLLPPGGSGSLEKPVMVKGTSQHEVKSGETLSSIAQHYLGSPVRYREIYEINTDIMESPDSLKTGMILSIPLTNVATTIPESQALSSIAGNSGKHPRKKEEEIEMVVENSNSKTAISGEQLSENALKPKRFLAVKKMPGMSPLSSELDFKQ